jgi:hypothetical protein
MFGEEQVVLRLVALENQRERLSLRILSPKIICSTVQPVNNMDDLAAKRRQDAVT